MAAVLGDVDRSRALAETGLSAAPDPVLDAIAERVRRQLRTPVALVSLVTSDAQLLPGMAGLSGPRADRRRILLTTSLCQLVVVTARPLVVADARTDERTRASLAPAELGIVGYAGYPLTDRHGAILGALCAIDTDPREWSATELDMLEGLAELATAELRLRIALRDAADQQQRSENAEIRLRQAYDRSQLLLVASQALAETTGVDGIRHQVANLVSGDLEPAYVGVGLLGDPADELSAVTAGLVAGRGGLLLCPDPDALAAVLPPPLLILPDGRTLRSIACAPLLSAGRAIGALAFGWDEPHTTDVVEQAVITSIAGYVAQALDQARTLERRTAVAVELQEAMLTRLPAVPGLRLAARYQPAADGERVGGDWYDVLHLLPRTVRDPARTLITVGDITGHDMHAAALMGQVRSMLRQAGWDHYGHPPSAVLTALERGCAATGTPATGTLLYAELTPDPAGDGWTMRWANAGHLPPLVRHRDGRTTRLDGVDIPFGYPDLRRSAPLDRTASLQPGDTLLLYTDGLVERPNRDLDAGLDVLQELFTATGGDPAHLLDVLLRTLSSGTAPDDIVGLAVAVDQTARTSGTPTDAELRVASDRVGSRQDDRFAPGGSYEVRPG